MALFKLNVSLIIVLLAASQVKCAIDGCTVYGNNTQTGAEICLVCRDGQVPGNAGLSCFSCPPGCFSCVGNSTCISCYLGFRLENGACTSSCSNGCTRCGLSGCEACQTGFYLNRTFMNCQGCGERCIECSKIGTCDVCRDEFQKTHIKDTLEDFYCDDKPSKAGLWIVLGLAIGLFLLGVGLCWLLYNPKSSFLYKNYGTLIDEEVVLVNNGAGVVPIVVNPANYNQGNLGIPQVGPVQNSYMISGVTNLYNSQLPARLPPQISSYNQSPVPLRQLPVSPQYVPISGSPSPRNPLQQSLTSPRPNHVYSPSGNVVAHHVNDNLHQRSYVSRH